MAAEYLANAEQLVALNAPINFTASIPCNRGWVYHEDETGIFILRGMTNGQCFATYHVTFNGNIAVATADVASMFETLISTSNSSLGIGSCMGRVLRL